MYGPEMKNNVSVPGLNLAKNNPQSSDLLIKKAKTLNVEKIALTKIFFSEISDK